MASNLPPGVTERMIPGNRPEDEWDEKFGEHIFDRIIPPWCYDTNPETVAVLVVAHLHALEPLIKETYAEGEQQGKDEVLMELGGM